MESKNGLETAFEKPKEKSTFLLITKMFILDYLVILWKNIKEIYAILKYYLLFGLLPHKKPNSFDKQLEYSKKVLGIYLILAVFRIIVFELSNKDQNTSNLLQAVSDLFIVVFYYFGTILFCLLGKAVAFICYRKQTERTVEAYMLQEFNFLFLSFFVINFFGIVQADNFIWFCLFCWLHSFYSYFIVFYKNKLFIRFKRTLLLVPFITTVIMLFILAFVNGFDSLKFTDLSQ